MSENRLSRFEERIQALVEGGFARLFAGRLQPREVALRLARAMEDGAVENDTGQLAAPNRYAVHLNPHDRIVLLEDQPDLAAVLAEHLVALAHNSGLWLDEPPDVVLVPDTAVAPHQVLVLAEHHAVMRQSTQMMKPVEPDGDSQAELPPAYLLVDGTRYIALDRSVINIGRRRDNTIVIDDQRVSRQHCQVRFRFGRFVLYDLGSRGGTFVNNARVTESVLHPGDVISLAGVQLLYVQDDGTTQPRKPQGDTSVQMTRDLLDGMNGDPGDDEGGAW